MRPVHLVILVLVGTFTLAGQRQNPPVSRPVFESPPVLGDRYSVSVVNAALQFLERGGSSLEIKTYLWPLSHLGDRVSIAALKIYSADELTKPENASLYLVVARNAFLDRSGILEKSDIDPKVTLFVLAYLKEKEVSSPGIEKRIAYLQGCVKDFTCSSQGEYDFCRKP